MQNDNTMPKNPNTVSSLNSDIPQTYPVGKPTNNKKKIVVLVVVFLILLILGGLYFFLDKGGDSKLVSPFSKDNKLEIGSSENMVVAPLTGELFSEKDSKSWFNERPYGVMINNYIDARPQTGLVDADLVYEVVAEGGITRFLAFFLTENPEKIGPVRSTREYYLVLVKELSDAMIMHIGWSPQALTAIETWPVRSLARGGASFWRDNPDNVATEHTAYVSGPDLRELAVTLGWEGKGDITVWTFKDDASKYAESEEATDLAIDFWFEGDYSGIFKYDSVNNTYLRYTGYDADGNPIAHKDRESKEQVAVSNVIVQFCAESGIEGDDKNRLEYELVGSGEALVFLDGKVVTATWTKEDRDSRTMFYDTNGEEIAFNRGKFWVSIVPDRNVDQVVYQ